MKKLQILGTGCAKCKQLAAVTEHAAESLGLPFQIEKVTEIRDIMAFGVMTTPALVVDGVVKISGRVPSMDEVRELIK